MAKPYGPPMRDTSDIRGRSHRVLGAFERAILGFAMRLVAATLERRVLRTVKGGRAEPPIAA